MQYQMYTPCVSDEFWISLKIQVDLDKKILSQDVQVNDLNNIVSFSDSLLFLPAETKFWPR